MTDHLQSEKDQPVLRVDGHVDITYFMLKHKAGHKLSDLEHGPFTLKKAAESGFRLFCNALYCEDRYNGEDALPYLQKILEFTLDRFDRVLVVRTAGELNDLGEDMNRIGTLLLLENADALAGNTGYLEELIQAGVRIVGLTHAGRNRLADGNAVLYPEGLTKEGKEVIRALIENRLVIDIAHLHPACVRQLLMLFEGPVINSHTGVRKICNIQRNIGMEDAGEIISRGGILGISFNPELLSRDGEADVETVFSHLDVLVQKFGPDGVGIGSDYFGFSRYAKGLEEITGTNALVDLMIGHGYGRQAVEKIMGLNWYGFFKKHLSD